jgi:hypothetical protein
MKKGFFKALFPLLVGLCFLHLNGCASLLYGDDDDPGAYDRGYQAVANDGDPGAAESSDSCTGNGCDTETGVSPQRTLASTEDEGGPVDRVKQAIETRDIILGMTRQDVLDSWGQPLLREIAGNGTGGHERWTYGSRYSLNGSRTVIFENGRVAGWNR